MKILKNALSDISELTGSVFIDLYLGKVMINGKISGGSPNYDLFDYAGAVIVIKVDMESGEFTWFTKNGTQVGSLVFSDLTNGQDWYFTSILGKGKVEI